MSNLSEFDLKTVCRICLTASDDMKSLYETSFTNIEFSLAEILMSFTSLKCFVNDGFPTQICDHCNSDLYHAYTFQSKCSESDKLLHKYFGNTQQIEEINILQTNDNSVKGPASNADQTLTNKVLDPLAIPETIPAIPETIPAIPETIPAIPETIPAIEITEINVETAISDLGDAKYYNIWYACVFCNMSFKSKDNLKVHIRKHTGEKPYSCYECNASFIGNTTLKRHMSKHNGEKPYTCNICYSSFTLQKSWARHMRKHASEKLFTCKICYCVFRLKLQLTAHMHTHAHVKPYVCTMCAYSSKYKHDLSRHLRTHKKNFVPIHPKIPDLIISNNDAQLVSSESQLLVKDPLEITETQTDVDENLDVIKTEIDDAKNENAPDADLYSCHKCAKTFKHNKNLTEHIAQTHQTEERYTCVACDKSYRLKQHLTRHMRRHGGDVVLPSKAVHIKPKPFACTSCSSTFSHATVLRVHMRTHTGEKPFACDICGRSFRQKCHLQVHTRKYH